ncbi:aminoglycoside phosphotransferase family protein, partial [Candidatus Sumerlaeota bacterium]|nr:aminoglycoside phosphotransferase family protein [Candidatus Sumerlaeota bacterium]
MNTLSHYLSRRFLPYFPPRKIEGRIGEYLSSAAAPRLGVPPQSAEIEKIQTGAITIVRRWRTTERGTLYVRAWRWDRHERPAHEHITVSRLFKNAGLAVPDILLHEDSLPFIFKWGMEVVIESEAQGQAMNFEAGDQAGIQLELARQLARLHQVQGGRWGKPWRPINEQSNPRRYWMGRLRKFSERITPGSSGLPPEMISRGLALAREWISRIRFENPVLIHNDINRANLFVSASGQMTWIDFGTAQYGFPEEDIAGVRMLMDDEARFEEFRRAYSEHSKEGRGFDPEILRTMTMMRIWEKINSRLKRRKHRAERDPSRDLAHLQSEQRK